MNTEFSRQQVASPWQPVNADGFLVLRAPQPAEELSAAAFRWLAKLPEALRPIETGRQYARIVNRMATASSHPLRLLDYLNSLMISDRPSRQGFPPEVGREIAALHQHFSDQLPPSADVWADRKYM